MVQDIPPPPPEALVIRLAREATGMTAQSAAEAAKALDPSRKGVSAAYWRDTERGYGYRRGERVPSRASARVLALMARVAGVRPGQLAEAGRADAAEVLEAALHRDQPGIAPVAPQPQLPFPAPVSLAERAERRAAQQMKAVVDTALDRSMKEVLAEVAAVTASFPQARGSDIFTDGIEARLWDMDGMPPEERARFIGWRRLNQAAQGAARFA